MPNILYNIEIYRKIRKVNSMPITMYNKRVEKTKLRLQYDWQKVTQDEIDIVIGSMQEVLQDESFAEELILLTKKLKNKMAKALPEYFV